MLIAHKSVHVWSSVKRTLVAWWIFVGGRGPSIVFEKDLMFDDEIEHDTIRKHNNYPFKPLLGHFWMIFLHMLL